MGSNKKLTTAFYNKAILFSNQYTISNVGQNEQKMNSWYEKNMGMGKEPLIE